MGRFLAPDPIFLTGLATVRMRATPGSIAGVRAPGRSLNPAGSTSGSCLAPGSYGDQSVLGGIPLGFQCSPHPCPQKQFALNPPPKKKSRLPFDLGLSVSQPLSHFKNVALGTAWDSPCFSACSMSGSLGSGSWYGAIGREPGWGGASQTRTTPLLFSQVPGPGSHHHSLYSTPQT